ncbi:hypothetical protein J2S43_002516 [Catenuloplanes nepalensis]|uniref:ABC transporter permease n=1 Tax=Catenuloplanes nepalensis TaxID=587533 RepID=A0ABT9MRE7_9ACTN|nr:hypothetical protein [Catenuloplanes nepalensis]MDP9794004.1 hypothetical protein [Catenuloplanes nepalensis]
MIAPIRTELRRSNARVTALLVLAATSLLIANSYPYWRVSSGLAGQELMVTLTLGVPLVLACGAILGRREARTRAVDLMASTGRPRWQRFLPSTVALGGAVAATFLLVVVAALVAVVAGDGYLGLHDVAMPLIGALILAGATWIGIGAGRLWSSPILPPLLAAGTLVLLFASPPLPLDGRFTRWSNMTIAITPGAATPWETPTAAALLARLALAAGLATAGLLLIAGRSWFARAGAVAALAAGLAGMALIVPPGAAAKWRIDPAAQRLVCADGPPQVCVTEAHEYLLSDVASEARRALDALAVLPGAPTRVAEVRLDTAGDNTDAQWQRFTPNDEPGTVYVALSPDTGIGRDPGVAQRIVMGGGTYLSHCGPRGDVDVPMSVTGAWLLGTEDFRVWSPSSGYWGSDESQPEIRERLRALRALPEAEQLARVIAVRDAAQRCEPDLMTPLTAGTPS